MWAFSLADIRNLTLDNDMPRGIIKLTLSTQKVTPMPRAKIAPRTKTHKTSTHHKTRKSTKAVKGRAITQSTRPHIIKHHAKRLWHATPMFVHGMVTGAFIGLVLVFSLGKPASVDALTLSATRDCDSYAIIHCGALSTAELKKDYTSADVTPIYRYFGITATDINYIGSRAVAGRVYDNGVVKVQGKVVATKAITAARKFVKGSHKVTVSGHTYYVRYVSASFSRTSEAAFVVMKNGVFDYAVLGPCGNPIKATAKSAPTPVSTTAQPTSTTPTNTPPIDTTPAPQPVKPKVTMVAKITTLPNTGPGAIIMVLTLSVLGGYIFHRTHHHVRRRRRYHYLG